MFPLIEAHFKANRLMWMKRLSFRFGGDEHAAEDVLQEAYYRALKYHKNCDPDRFDQWFSIIVRNSFNHYKNQEKGYSEYDDTDEEAIDCQHYSEQVLREIEELINTKSVNQIEILTHHFINGYSAKEISEMTEHSHSNIRQIIHRFRNELKELYRE